MANPMMMKVRETTCPKDTLVEDCQLGNRNGSRPTQVSINIDSLGINPIKETIKERRQLTLVCGYVIDF